MRSEWQAWSWVLASSTPSNLLIFSSWLNGQHSVSSKACVFIDIKEILLKITTKKNWKRKKTKLKTGHATRNWRSKMQQENESWKINYQGAYRISVGLIFSFATAHEGSDPPHPMAEPELTAGSHYCWRMAEPRDEPSGKQTIQKDTFAKVMFVPITMQKL